MSEKDFVHIPVLSGALLAHLSYPPGAVVVDATVGQGGHAALLAGRLGSAGLLLGVDVDPGSLASARRRLAGVSCRVELVRENFGQLGAVLAERNIDKVDVILADIGFCSAQVEDPARGMSFQHDDSPLDMRLDDRLERTAAWLVNRLGQKELADLIYRYGEERQSRRIARFVCEARGRQPLTTTGELRDLIVKAIGFGKSWRPNAIHPATRTFQALRIAVNRELDQLQALLNQAPGLLKPGGQIAVIGFHSLEDRIVKTNFNENRRAGIYELMTRKPMIADENEMNANPRSRSAKLRIARRSAFEKEIIPGFETACGRNP